MNDKKGRKTTIKKAAVRSAKECAYVAVFVALVIAAQVVLASVPNVEVVTVLFVTYAYVFGVKRGMAAATAFAVLRQLVFGFFPTVLILYLTYYNVLTLAFGLLGKAIKKPWRGLFWLVLTACVCTVCFTLLDNVITPLWYGYSAKAARAYFMASLPYMGVHVVNAGVSVGLLFMPLQKAFALVSRPLTK